MYWNGEWGWLAWLSMTVTMVLFWGAVVWAVFNVVRSPRRTAERSAQQLLDERLARGDISVEEYHTLTQALAQHQVPT